MPIAPLHASLLTQLRTCRSSHEPVYLLGRPQHRSGGWSTRHYWPNSRQMTVNYRLPVRILLQ